MSLKKMFFHQTIVALGAWGCKHGNKRNENV